VSHRRVRLGTAALSVGALLVPVAVAVTPARATSATSAPMIRASGQRSDNWSGYALTGSYSRVTGAWTVPKVDPAGPAVTTYASTWIGLDGMANRNLIQTGTESDVVDGVVHYDAWWEILPAPERMIPKMTVSPGDRMAASITRGSGRRWTMSLTDITTGALFAVTRTYRGAGASAEWIVERPQVGRSLATLSNFGTTVFTGLTTNGTTPGLTPAEAISMVGTGGSPVISAPSAPSPLRDAFTVAYGPSAPPPPTG